jgi:mRNA interferase HigB
MPGAYEVSEKHRSKKSRVEQSFRDADYTPSGRTIFDIGGNKYRLIARIDFEEQLLLIEKILTHEEYDREDL